jgi:thiamine kinase-like enzyme
VEQLREYLFQILFSLHRAQEQYKFVHGDLHFRNILLQHNLQKVGPELG